jgi:hypothetical protein
MVMSDQNWHDLGLEELWNKLEEEQNERTQKTDASENKATTNQAEQVGAQ